MRIVLRGAVWLGIAACEVHGGRVPVFDPSDDGWHYELPQSEGECADDGDCVQGGCGNHCVSADAEPFAATCEYAEHNDYASCGCVHETCRWYLSVRSGG